VKYDKVGRLLYLVGENLDKARAHYQAETGRIVPLMRGICADADKDAVQCMIVPPRKSSARS